jgi:serine phosphatase RsbU (regulator of sigma subunit)
MCKTALAVFLLGASTLSLRAQSFDASQWTQGVTTINTPWRFHPGDNPDWASPSFDDSTWSLLGTDRFWGNQGYTGLTGYAWYRLRLKLPATTQPLAIDIGHINSAAEIYIDGQLIGTNGIMRPKADWSEQRDANSYPLPVSCNGRWAVVALRVWKSPVASSYSTGGLRRHPVVGSLPQIATASRVAFDNAVAAYLSSGVVQLFTLVLGCFSLGLFLLNRRSTEYAWFALWSIGTVAAFFIRFAVNIRQGSVTFAEGDLTLIRLPFDVSELLFLWGFLRARRGWLLLATIVLNVVGACTLVLAFHGFLSLPAGHATQTAATTLVYVLVIVRILFSLRAGSRDARMLLLPVVLLGFAACIDGIREVIFTAGLGHTSTSTQLILWSNHLIAVKWSDLFEVLYLIVIAAGLILRFTRSAREEKRLATELDSARAIQARLVPAELPALPGLHLSATYLPATEVGGDFYQIFPQNDGAVLFVVGDVSGKGLRAAMTGTLVLGALRSLAQEPLSPSQILCRLNQQLASSFDGGFVTCLCARIDPDGSLALANAGHLAPYRNGEECEVDSGLPLGIAAAAEYTEINVHLDPGDALTFLSDGVVEAQAPNGELFGFDRTRAISQRAAEEIAATAQRFGQEDDITVLTVTLSPVAAMA